MNIFRIFLSKKIMKICFKMHHLKKFTVSMHPNRSRHETRPEPQKYCPPLANPAYAHTLNNI